MLYIFKGPHNDRVKIFNITKTLNKNKTIPRIFNSHKFVVDTMLIRLHPPPIFKKSSLTLNFPLSFYIILL